MKSTFIMILALLLAPSLDAEQTRTLEKHVLTLPSQRVELMGFSGSKILFRSWAKDEVYIKLNISISSSDDDYEQQYIRSVNVDEESTATVLRLRWSEPSTREDVGSFFSKLFKRFFLRKEISGEVYVPQSNPLTTDLRYGTLTLEDMKGQLRLDGTSNSLTIRNCSAVGEVDNRYGTTVIEGSGGSLTLDGTSSTVTIDGFTGKADIEANYSTVTIDRVSADLTVTNKSGKLDISDIGGDANVDADYSTTTITGVKGFLDLKSKSGTVKVRKVGGIRADAKYSAIGIIGVSGESGKEISITGQSGSLELEDITGNVSIDDPYSEITLKRITGNVELTSTSATITAEEIKGSWNSRANYSTLRVETLSAASIVAKGKSSQISFRLKTVPRKIDIENEYADVTVELPKGFSGSIELDSEYGTIDTNFPIKKSKRGNAGYLSGKVGSGDASISITSKSATIQLTEE